MIVVCIIDTIIVVRSTEATRLTQINRAGLNLLLDMLREWQHVETAEATRIKHLVVFQCLTLKDFLVHLFAINFSVRVDHSLTFFE